ncbi:MAG: hypothetical protein ACOC5F_06585 [Candidatus Aminicenantaceae bacterium]
MNRKRKVGILLILIGIGIPLVLFFFQNRKGNIVIMKPKYKTEYHEIILDPKDPKDAEEINLRKIAEDYVRALPPREPEKSHPDKNEKNMTTDERGLVHDWEPKEIMIHEGVKIHYKYPLVTGIILILVGVGIVIFSFFPRESKHE